MSHLRYFEKYLFLFKKLITLDFSKNIHILKKLYTIYEKYSKIWYATYKNLRSCLQQRVFYSPLGGLLMLDC
jgi:hypothetical protein